MKKCKQCGNCCSSLVLISKKEKNTIESYIRKNNIKLKEDILIKKNKFDCKFLYNYKCIIYDVRPQLCKKYECSVAINKLKKLNLIEEHNYIINNVEV